MRLSPDYGARSRLARATLARSAALFMVWCALLGTARGREADGIALPLSLADAMVGVVAAVCAAWASVWLLPPGTGRWSPNGIARLVVHFVRHSVVAGIDVARRAFDPRMPLHPGEVRHRSGLAAGPARDAFAAFTSLMPGTLPVATEGDDVLVYHCLDVERPVASSLAMDEAVFVQALGVERRVNAGSSASR